MAIPDAAAQVEDNLDPHEELDFKVDLSGLLEAGEAIASGTWTLTVLAESAALGLTIMTGSGRDPALADGESGANCAVVLWLEIADAYKTNAAFDDPGTELAFEILAPTNVSPARTRNRTCKVLCVQQ